MRKNFLLLALVVLAGTQAWSQSAINTMTAPMAYSPPLTIFGPNNPDMTFVGNADIQDQFLSRLWTPGKVKFKNGQMANGLYLLFDVHSNKLYFLQDKVAMEFINPIEEFVIGLVIGKDTVDMNYRASYPAINTNTTETFYEVLVDGQTQLLRCRAKNIGMYKDDAQPESKRFTEKEQLYIYHEGQMVKIKKDKEEIKAALPKLANKIEQIADIERLRLKHEEGVRKLVIALNKM